MSCRTILSRLMMFATFLLLATAAQAQCPPGFTGEDCDIDINECASSPCVRGECQDQVNGYRCECPPGFTGVNCEFDIDECASNPCLHGGACGDRPNGYQCFCRAGFTGANCEVDINECESNPCVHGDCGDRINGYECFCDPGFTGVNCDFDINECESSPCVRGTCMDLVNEFLCICHEGFTGVLCDTDIDECLSEPCLNGGDCTDLASAYSCSCAPGWTGTNCEIPVVTLDCSGAVASPGLLWPPNHQLVPITILDVTDPNGGTVTITITGVTQDEPVNGLGDGDTSPDATGVGTTSAKVRAERAGNGDGRVYHISFSATSTSGGSCTGTATVGVPKSQGKKGGPVDGGALYDSTQP